MAQILEVNKEKNFSTIKTIKSMYDERQQENKNTF